MAGLPPIHSGVKRDSRSSSHDFDPEQFPADLLSSTKHDDLDGSPAKIEATDPYSNPNDVEASTNAHIMQFPKVTSTGSMDMVSEELYNDNHCSDSPDFVNKSLRDIEYNRTAERRIRCCRLCCIRCKFCCRKCSSFCSVKDNPLPSDSTRCQRFRYAFLCPVHGWVGNLLTYIIAVLLLGLTLWALTGNSDFSFCLIIHCISILYR